MSDTKKNNIQTIENSCPVCQAQQIRNGQPVQSCEACKYTTEF
ncbi:hypothetical protein [Pelosinus sp. UFO1]|nr:hypothetical protein [Pelosinus sp. UFO1]